MGFILRIFKRKADNVQPTGNTGGKETFNDYCSGNYRLPDFDDLSNKISIDLNRVKEVESVVAKIIPYMNRYKAVEAKTGVPWDFIAAIHYRELGSDLGKFQAVLHNGESLANVNRRGTTLVPKGRGPKAGQTWTWEDAAVDALGFDGLIGKIKTKGDKLKFSEKFNGLGYRTKIGDHGCIELSPYVFAGTNLHDETGKYIRDGVYSATSKEAQLGTASILKGLEKYI